MSGRGILRSAALAAVLLAGCRSLGGAATDSGVEFDFTAGRSFSDAELAEAATDELADFRESAGRRAHADDAAFELELFYARRGFPFTEVTYRVQPGEGAVPTLLLVVNEGPRTILAPPGFEGVHVFEPDALDELFEAPRAGILGTGERYYVESEVQAGRERVLEAYANRGYLDASVEILDREFSDDRSRVNVTVGVQEGVRYTLRGVSIEGEIRDADLESEVRALATRYASREDPLPFAPRLGYRIRGEILALLARRGRPDATVELEPESDPATGDVHLTYRVVPGPEVTLGRIRFVGNDATRASFLRSRMKLEPGTRYDGSKLRESVERLYATGLFQRVGTDLSAADAEGDRRDLTVTLVEEPSVELFAETGYGSYERFRLSGGVREKNLFGTGRRLRIESTLAVLAQRATIGITDPWFLRSEVAADLSIDYERRELPSFTSRQTASGFFLTREWTREHSTTFGYQFRRSRISDVEVVDEEVQDALDDVDISSLSLTQRMDKRDDFFVPTRGAAAEASMELSQDVLGSDLDFLRGAFLIGLYRELREGTVGAMAARTGVIAPFGDTETIPLQERFFNGGENSVRSFREDELGPKDSDGNSIGGEAYSTLGFELRQRLTRNLQGALFYDLGNVTPKVDDYFELDGYAHGVGVGLRYLLPVGPVRLDLAANPDRDEGESTWVLHFSIGMAF